MQLLASIKWQAFLLKVLPPKKDENAFRVLTPNRSPKGWSFKLLKGCKRKSICFLLFRKCCGVSKLIGYL
jgi:hypothetical protein